MLVIEESLSLMAPIMRYLLDGAFLNDPVEVKRLAKEASYYTIVGGQLYRRSLLQPLLKCLTPNKVNSVLEEVHKGSCGYHLGRKVLALKIFRVGYYWPTMTKNAVEFVKKCLKCQRHANFHNVPAE